MRGISQRLIGEWDYPIHAVEHQLTLTVFPLGLDGHVVDKMITAAILVLHRQRQRIRPDLVAVHGDEPHHFVQTVGTEGSTDQVVQTKNVLVTLGGFLIL